MFKRLNWSLSETPRWGVGLRVLVVVVAGYALASALSLLLASLTGAEGREVRSVVSVGFFLFYAASFVWLFSLPRHAEACFYAAMSNGVAWMAVWFWGANL